MTEITAGEMEIDPALLALPATRADLWILISLLRHITAIQGMALAAAINKKPEEYGKHFGDLAAAFTELDGRMAKLVKSKRVKTISSEEEPLQPAFSVEMIDARRSFRIGIVGESFRPAAIARCSPGDLVELRPELDNAYDPRAVAVYARGQQIGYLPRDGWLTRALIDDQEECEATILDIHQPDGERRFPAVVLQVHLA